LHATVTLHPNLSVTSLNSAEVTGGVVTYRGLESLIRTEFAGTDFDGASLVDSAVNSRGQGLLDTPETLCICHAPNYKNIILLLNP